MPVTGGKELAATFRAMADAPTAAVRKRAREKALKPIRDGAKERLAMNGNIETRQLINKVSIADGENANRSVVSIKRGKGGKMNRNPVRYAHLVEFGTAPHWQPNRFGGIMHPGASPSPFMRPSFEINKDAAMNIYFTEVWTAIVSKAKR